MKKTLKLRVLSIAVVLFMLLAALPIGIFANEETEEEQISPSAEQIVEEVPFEFPYLPGDIPLYELKDAVLDLSEVPAVISRAQIEEYDHVNRLYEQEPDEYTVIFQNRDGGKTVYVFDRPVKTQTAGGTFSDMTASAIVSASQNNTSVAMMTVGISNNTATTLKAMQSRLEAYKSALDLQPYNMLEDQMETQTLTTAGLSADLSSPMQITPNNSTAVMSVSNTYSELAGEYAIKSLQNNGYIRQQNNALAMNTSIYSPYSKWVFTYVGSEGYIIESASKVGYVLAYDIYGADTVSLQQYYEGSLMDDYSFYWGIDADPDGDSNTNIVTEYCHIVASHVGKLLKGNLSLTYNDGSDPAEVRWQFTNNLDYFPLQSVSFEEGVLYAPDESTIGFPTLKPNPTNASYSSDETNYEWLSTNEELIYYDVLGYSTGSGNGIAQIYCRHKYTGIESVRLTVIVGGVAPTFINGRTYIIRKHSTSLASSPALTMTVGASNPLSMVAFGGLDNNPGLTTEDYQKGLVSNISWYNSVQAFTITPIESTNRYRVSAILARSQYGNGKSYVNKYTKSNTLYVEPQGVLDLKRADDGSSTTGTPNDTDLSQQWYIHNISTGTVFINAAYPQYALKYESNSSTVSLTVVTNLTNATWSVTHFGVDAPCIKQYTDYYCGAASALQALYARGYNIGNWASQQNDLWTAMGLTLGNSNTAPSTSKVTNLLNNKLPADPYTKDFISAFSNESSLINSVSVSLQNGYALIFRAREDNIRCLPYCGNNYPYDSGHYINIIGYDIHTGKVLISDCNFNSKYYGLHVFTAADNNSYLYNSVYELIYYQNN